jgi:hypothetical protein
LYDLAHLGVGEDFLYEVEKSLLPGKAAVVAEVWEEWTLPVDTRMEALGGSSSAAHVIWKSWMNKSSGMLQR